MIVRYAGRSVHIGKVTPQAIREVFTAQDIRDKLTAATQELIRESANGPSLALRRLSEKVARQQKRLAQYEPTTLPATQDNPKGKARARSTVRSDNTADASARRSNARGLGGHNSKAERRAAVKRKRARNAATGPSE